MALDLSGFTIPEQKFEGLYKLGEELAAQRKEAAAEKAAAEKAAKELKTNQAANLMWLKNATDSKAYLTGKPTDSEVVDRFQEAYIRGNDLINENPGMSTSQLSQAMTPYINDISDYSLVAKNADKAITEATAKLNPKYYNINRANELLRQNTFYKKDDKGNLVKKGLNEVQITPDLFQNALKEQGYEIMNSQAILDAVKSIGKSRKDITVPIKGGKGHITTTKVWSPWQELRNDEVVPRQEEQFDVDASGTAVPMTFNGQKVVGVPDDVYRSIVELRPEAEDWLNSQLHLHASEYGLSVDDETSPQAIGFKKKLLYDALNPMSTYQYGKSIRERAPSKAKTGGGTGDATGGGQTTGNVLDEIGISQPLDTQSGARVQNGSVTTADGKPYNGNIYIEKKYFPSTLISVLKAGGVEFKGAGATFDVVNGTIQNMRTPKGIVDRNAIITYQEKYNTEPKGGLQPTFGAKAVDAAKGVYQKVKTAVTPKPSPKPSTYDANTQAKIKKFAEANKLSMDDAIKILKSKKLIK